MEQSIDWLSKTSRVLDAKFKGSITKPTFDDEKVFGNEKKKIIGTVHFEHLPINKSIFKQVIADVSYIDDFEVEMATQQLKQSIITLYNTHTDTKMLFKNIGIDILTSRILDNQTVFLDENQLKLLFEKAPYLVSMATVDLAGLSPEDFIEEYQQGALYIPSPRIEPTIGVIDTLFDKHVYFSEWVEYYDIIFVVAGTNKPNNNIVKIGSPADSINSMVVNAVTKKGLSTKYARKGLALSFFAKPDVSYYGGSEEQYIKVCEPLGAANVAGTSFAAPWIARKLSYLIDILGLNREVAKAMIIDAARDWNENPTPEEVALYGHGVVPVKIGNIVQTKDDEIKFLVSDVSEKWNTYNYHFPVPIKDDKYPYIARATMCYFPICDRTQGVDYTNTELNLHFGRIQDSGKLKEINNDKQNQDETLNTEKSYLLEGEARGRFRKWDNVKYVSETPNKRLIPKMSYKNKNWGMEIKTNNRLEPKDGMGIRFGVIVTLKEINGVNRIDEFIKNCTLNGWLVNRLDIQTRIDINEKVNEDIKFE